MALDAQRGFAIVQRHFATTTIAAPGTLFAKVILTTVLGAGDANSSGFLFADTASKRHGASQFPDFFLGGAAAGLEMTSRQRCAS
jgi:hypothetical protein